MPDESDSGSGVRLDVADASLRYTTVGRRPFAGGARLFPRRLLGTVTRCRLGRPQKGYSNSGNEIIHTHGSAARITQPHRTVHASAAATPRSPKSRTPRSPLSNFTHAISSSPTPFRFLTAFRPFACTSYVSSRYT